MKYVDRSLKGTYLYIRKQLVFEMIKTVILFAMAFGIFFIGLLTLHTKKSLWSVFAVLALLPACKSLVGVIMLARFKSLSPDEYDRYTKHTQDLPTIFENILTTDDKTFFVPVISVMAGNVIALAKPGTDDKKLRCHIEKVLGAAGHKASVMIFDNEDGFAKRCADLRDKFSKDDRTSSYNILKTLKAVSL